jgi:hypothetical protein
MEGSSELEPGPRRPSDEALGSAINALRDAEQESVSDARRARDDGDELGASEHIARAQRLREVVAWLESLL